MILNQHTIDWQDAKLGQPGATVEKAGDTDQAEHKLLPSHFVDVSKLVNAKYATDFGTVKNDYSDKVPMWRACGCVFQYAKRQEEERRRKEGVGVETS